MTPERSDTVVLAGPRSFRMKEMLWNGVVGLQPRRPETTYRRSIYSLVLSRRRFALLRPRRDTFRHVATYVDRILRGEKPGDSFSTKLELVVNLKTAVKVLGLTVPRSGGATAPPRSWEGRGGPCYRAAWSRSSDNFFRRRKRLRQRHWSLPGYGQLFANNGLGQSYTKEF